MFIGLLQYIFMFSYISSNSYEKPLSPEDEEKYFTLFKGEDPEESKKAKNVLIEHNMRLVAHVVKRYNNNGRDLDDLIQIGSIGLIKGISTYKMDKKVRLATYACVCINNEILMHLRTSKKYMGDIYLQDIIGVDGEGNEVKIEDRLSDDSVPIDEQVNTKIQVALLEDLVEKILFGREKYVIELRYGLNNKEELTQREIAEKMDISRSYVSRIEKKALEKLNKAMNNI